jgi:hypothetical protein
MSDSELLKTPDTSPAGATQNAVAGFLSETTDVRAAVEGTLVSNDHSADSVESAPTWSMTIQGHFERQPITVTITPGEKDTELHIGCSGKFISRTLNFKSSEEVRCIQTKLSALSGTQQAELASKLGYKEHQDAQIDDMEGAAGCMKKAILEACGA